MTRAGRKGWLGLAVGVGAGIAAAVLLAPRRRNGSEGSRVASAADGVLDLARGVVDCARSMFRAASAPENAGGLLPDERVSIRVQSELERRGIWTRATNVTTIDGTVYIRGREPDAVRADMILHAVREVPGVVEVVDELKRD